MAGVQAGRLSIELVAEIARLQQDLDKAKRAVSAASKDIARNTRAANDNLTVFGRGFRSVSEAAGRFSHSVTTAGRSASGFANTARTVGAALMAVAGATGARTFLNLADQYKQLTAQLKLATAQSGSFSLAQEDVRRIAAETRGGLEETAKLYATFARSSQELGISQAQVATITQTVNQAFKVSGATTSEASNAIRQLSQAFASGVLRGDEFNSMMENAPRLAKLLADSLGVPVGKLREMAAEGELTAAKLTRALSDKKFTEGLDAEFRELPVTFDEAMGQVYNSAILTFGAFDRGGEFSTAIANFVMDGSSGFRNLEVEAENLGIEMRATFAGLSDAWGPLIDGAMDAFDIIGDGAVSLADRFRPLMGEIDAISGWVGRQGLIGRLATGGSVSDWWNERPTRGTTMLRDFDESYNKTRTDLEMRRIFRNDPLAEWGGLTGGRASGAAAVAAAKPKDKGGSKRAAGLSEEARALKRRNEETERFIKNLDDEIAKIGLDDKAIRQLKVTREIETATTEAQKTKIKELSDAREKAIELAEKEAKAKRDREQASGIRDDIRLIDEETRMTAELGVARRAAMQGLSGDALEDELARLTHQHQQNLEAVRAQLETEKLRADGLTETALATDEAAAAASRLADQQFVDDQAMRNIERANAELRDMIGLLQSIGGLGSVLGGALGFLTGNDDAIGGSLGFLLKMKSGGSTADADGKIIAKTIGDELRDVFGDFGKDLTVALKGAATGMVAANAVMGKQNTGGQIGSALGGAVGQALGTKLLGSLGAAAGPLGAIAGGLLGGVLGGLTGSLFKKTKWGRADISGVSSDPYMRGNSNSMKSSAGDAASSIIDSLKQIADELGGVAGEFSKISIGVRDGKWRVNTTGTSLKISKGAIDFGKDGAEEAIAYAISEAIKAGAITGLRESTLTLLKAGDDFNAQLQKAMTFENVFKELQAELDPLGYELDQISKKFASLRTIFVEANATAEEMAQLDQLQALQEAKAREAAAAEAAATKAASLEKEAELLALQGKATQALAKSREAELLQMDKALVAIQKQINAEQDAATRRGLQIQLLEAQGNIFAAQELSRAEVLRVTLDENKAIQQKIWLTEDLFTAYNRESEALQNTADKMRGFSTTLREFRDSIYASDGSTSSYTQALAKLIQTGSLASTGDETALGNLPGVGKDFLDVAKNSAKSMLDFQRAQALVANYADQAIGYTDNAATVAEQQLAEMKTTVGALVTLNDSVISVEQAIERLAQHNAANTAPAPAPTTGTNPQSQNDGNRELRDEVKALRRQLLETTRAWNRMSTDSGDGIKVEVMP